MPRSWFLPWTTGGYNMAHQIIPEADAIIYFPLDMPFVSEFLCQAHHAAYLHACGNGAVAEFPACHQAPPHSRHDGNAVISDKSVKSYRYLYGILDDMMGSVTRFCMQSSIDAEYIEHLARKSAASI